MVQDKNIDNEMARTKADVKSDLHVMVNGVAKKMS